ncbi:MAG TPA: hypothetical protein VK747_12660 [Blastocatellia bacterium]|nr:hypothetical protein [Blastocatellia bacterium]
MSFPIFVEAVDGQFAASLIGAPNVRVVKPNRAQAITGLQAEIQQRVALGELLSLEIDAASISNLAGKYGSDPTLREICDEAYQLRDSKS